MRQVKAFSQPLTLATYAPLAADLAPMFLQRRVYQGSSGKVYPLPVHDRIAEQKMDRAWQAIHLENDFLRVVILPELGGRIHAAMDKSNNYDFIYRQDVIKPALVGLAGPWISGGIEFNWPQHHRPGTFMPCDVHIEDHADGSKTVWLGDHEPMNRMKGMHGVCLHPDKSYIEVKVRLFNRTPLNQTFLWWANVATRVHERYQSFFPPDVHYVADHAKRAMSRFPLCEADYYSINYRQRKRRGVPGDQRPGQFAPPEGLYSPDDLSWYANIPVPTSYMCMGTGDDFFGGYDHAAGAGIIHVANHHIAPGKKQWTWGNHDFGYAWDRNLTDPDADGVCHPYIELMAGVYTDNQPDFSFLAPGETKTFSQFWYPIQKIGPAQKANTDAAVSLSVDKGLARIGVAVTSCQDSANVRLSAGGATIGQWTANLTPAAPFVEAVELHARITPADLSLAVTDQAGRELIHFRPPKSKRAAVPPAATEPPEPRKIGGNDELYLTGLHLEQYRHATRAPQVYWQEALRRDPGDSRCNNAMGLWHFRGGEFSKAETHFRRAIARLTARNSNPFDGEPHYNLGLALQLSGGPDDAYAAFYKSTWNAAWRSPGYRALAELDCRRGDWALALQHLDYSLTSNTDDLRARDLKAIVLRKLGRANEASDLLRQTLALDPLDAWARHLTGGPLSADSQVCLDLALDYLRAGLFDDAIALLESAASHASSGAAPMVQYYLGFIHAQAGRLDRALDHYRAGAKLDGDYCFPSRLEEMPILQSAMQENPSDAKAPYYLGNLLYDRLRHRPAIALWERSARLDPANPIVWRNLGMGYFNTLRQPQKAARAYDKALAANPSDARVLYERDQLHKRLGRAPAGRLAILRRHLDLTCQRDDLSIELCALYNQTGESEKALEILSSRRFQPWEGGEGLVLGQYVRTHLALGRRAAAKNGWITARQHFQAALDCPPHLGEARHLLANHADIHYWLGLAAAAQGDRPSSRRHWTAAAGFQGDFREMSACAFSEMTYYSYLALDGLGKHSQARCLLGELVKYAKSLLKSPGKIPYFATSLPAMLLFEDDLQQRQKTAAAFLLTQADLAYGRQVSAKRGLKAILKKDPAHAMAWDLLCELTGD